MQQQTSQSSQVNEPQIEDQAVRLLLISPSLVVLVLVVLFFQF